jgi:hypothetical protein
MRLRHTTRVASLTLYLAPDAPWLSELGEPPYQPLLSAIPSTVWEDNALLCDAGWNLSASDVSLLFNSVAQGSLGRHGE